MPSEVFLVSSPLPVGLPSGTRGWTGASFEPGGQIGEMSAPATVDAGIVRIPVLPCTHICMGEMETGAIVFRSQFKRDRGGTRPESFPGITEAMRWLKHEDLAYFECA